MRMPSIPRPSTAPTICPLIAKCVGTRHETVPVQGSHDDSESSGSTATGTSRILRNMPIMKPADDGANGPGRRGWTSHREHRPASHRLCSSYANNPHDENTAHTVQDA